MRTVFLLLCLLVMFPASVHPAHAAPDVQALIDAAVAAKQPYVRLPGGIVRLKQGLVINHAEGLTVDGRGTTLVIEDIHSTAVLVAHSKDIVLSGFTVDYDPMPFTQGTVVSRSADGTHIEFAVHEGYPDLTPDYLQKHVHIFEAHTPSWKRLAPDIYPDKVEAIDPRRGRLTLPAGQPHHDQVQPGDRLVLNYRGSNGILVWQSENVRIRGVTLLAAPGCAVICRFMRGSNRFQFDVHPGPPSPGAVEPRLMSSSADAFNYAFARRGPVLENSTFSFMGDDSVNLHGPVLLVTQVISPTELLVAWPYGPEPLDWLIEPGDMVRRLQPGNYAVQSSAAVDSLTLHGKAINEQWELARAFWPRIAFELGPTLYRLILREPLNAHVGQALDIPAVNAPHYRIRNCEFSDHRARGVLLCGSNGIIENCTFRRLKRVGIKIDPDYAYWREAGWVENVIVRGNLLEDVGICPDSWARWQHELGAITVGGRQDDARHGLPYPPENRNIVIENNTIRRCSVAGIFVRSARDVIIRNNHLSHTNYVNAPAAGADHLLSVEGAIDVRDVPGVTLQNNEVNESRQ